MIIPTPDFDPMFAKDGVPFQTKMIHYIRREFADILGRRANLLERPGGLDILAQLYGPSASSHTDRRAA
jgi:hypothetical protein